MFARSLLCRLAAPKTSTQDAQQLTRLVRRTLFSNAAPSPAVRALSRVYSAAIADSRRAFATSAATEPTKTVKKAVKKAAATKPKAKKATTAKKTPAAKKTTKKTTAEKKAAAPKKRGAIKQTPEEKMKKYIKMLKELALKEPVPTRAVTAYNAFMAEYLGGGSSATKMSEAAMKFKNLSPSEREVSAISFRPISRHHRKYS